MEKGARLAAFQSKSGIDGRTEKSGQPEDKGRRRTRAGGNILPEHNGDVLRLAHVLAHLRSAKTAGRPGAVH